MTVNVTDTTPGVVLSTVEKQVSKTTVSGGTYVLDLSGNIINPGNLPMSYTVGIDDGETVEIEGHTLEIDVPEEIPDEGVVKVIAVTAAYGSGADEKLTYTYRLKFIDDGKFRIENGGFENELEGWTLVGENAGAISEETTYWSALPMHNDGKYFVSNDVGTLASPYFTVGGINKISFKLGAGGVDGCYVTLENENGDVFKVYRNYKFADTGDGDADKVGTEKFILNFVTYVADLTELTGERVRLVVHDDVAGTGGFAFINFDSLVTYYTDESELPTADKQGGRPVFDAVDELADMTALNAKLAEQNITEQGDYTEESYEVYTAKLAAATAISQNPMAKQTAVDNALSELNAAIANLAYRVPTEKTYVNKNFRLLAGTSKEIVLSDYVDTKDLSEITYELTAADDTYLTIANSDGTYTVTVKAETTGNHVVPLTLTVKHKDWAVLTVTLNITATDEVAATLIHEDGIEKNYDLFDGAITDKTGMDVDLSENIDNPKNLPLTYSVALDGGEAAELDGAIYKLTFGAYTDRVTTHTLVVTVTFTVSGETKTLEYNYVLNMTDTRAYRVANGGFDNDLEGWTLSNDELGRVNNATTYWNEKKPFNADGKFFNAYTDINDELVVTGGNEGAKGTLTSSVFTVGGSGWITYKLGGAKNPDQVYLEIVEDGTNNVLAKFYNNRGYARDNAKDCTLVPYKADLSAFMGKRVFIRITDDATGDYGLFFADSFSTYYKDGLADNTAFELAKDYKYQIANGGFDNGNLVGWTVVKNCSVNVAAAEEPERFINIHDCVIDRNDMWGEKLPFNNNGWFLAGLDTGIPDGDTWTIRSTNFELAGSGWISLRMGGRSAAVKVYKADGTMLGEYRSTHFHADDAYFPFIGDGDQKVSYGDMRTYFIDLHEYIGETLYLELSDRELNEGWAGATFDEVVTYYETAPETVGYDTVSAPVSRAEDNGLVYGEVQLAWRVAVKHEENA